MPLPWETIGGASALCSLQEGSLRNMNEKVELKLSSGLVTRSATRAIPRPPDFVEGEAREQLAAMILVLIDSLGCE